MIEENNKDVKKFKKRNPKGLTNASSKTWHDKPTKEEYQIAKYLRSKLPHREGKLAQNIVSIFSGNDAVTTLLESDWASGANKRALLFPNRNYVVEYLRILMMKNLFHRGLKVKKKVKKMKKLEDKKKTEESSKNTKDLKKRNKDGKIARMKLEIHEEQTFNPDDQDSSDDIYVWLYEPFNPWKLLLGALVLLVILIVCLFPIWPSHLRTIAYYGSIVLMVILAVLIGLVIVRSILFGFIWFATFGKHHFWLLPNLTEDCGVLESFKPLYLHESKKRKSKKDKTASTKPPKSTENGNVQVDGDDTEMVPLELSQKEEEPNNPDVVEQEDKKTQ